MSAVEPDATDESEVAPRQCARCRKMFPGDPEQHPVAIPAWWACQPCRETMFGTKATPAVT